MGVQIIVFIRTITLQYQPRTTASFMLAYTNNDDPAFAVSRSTICDVDP